MNEQWKMTPLGTVCDVDKAQGLHRNLPYVGLEHIESQTARFVGSNQPKTVKSSTFRFSTEHVLYGRLRPYLNKVLAPNFHGHCSTEIFPLKPRTGLSREYLVYWFLADETLARINATCTGARMPRADMHEVLGFEFPLPAPAEQRRIVSILDKAFEGIATAKANAEQNLRNARALFESHLQSVFTQRGREWANHTLGAVAEVQSGGTPSVPRKEYWGGDIPWYASGELNDIYTPDPERKITEVGLANSNAKLFPKGSLLIGMYDTAALKMSILDRDGTFNQAIAGVKPNSRIDVEFVLHAITAKKPILLLERRGVRQKNLSLGKIKAIAIPLPPVTEQRGVVSCINDMLAETQRLSLLYERKLASLESLKKSVMHQAFAGQL